MKKMVKWWVMGIIVCLEIFWFPIQIRAEGEIREPDSLYALSAVLMDGDSGRVLFEKNGEEQRPMASTTKIMTCILVLESGKQEETAQTSAYAASMPEVHMGAGEGEGYKVRDLLYGLMLESYNDAAVILAEHIGGSTQAFAEMMNEKAREIGCENTWFITPNGLDAQVETQEGVKIHSTTAEDLARILRYCIQDSPAKEEFLEITRTSSYTFTDTAGTKTISCTNHNAFLGMMEGALTGKTGFTADAGYCYVGALQRDGKTLIVATSKPESMAKQVLTHFHLADYFQFIGGASSDSLRVNKDDVIRYVMESCKLTEADRPSIVMVGDRRHDILGAHKAGLEAVGVLYGYGSREELSLAGADWIAGTVKELGALLTEI